MEKHIQINTNLAYNGGFSSNESILRIINYQIIENFNLVTGSTLPMQTTTAPKSVNINYQVYKSLLDFEAGNSPVNPLNFPYSINKAYSNEDIFGVVFDELTSKDLDVIIVEGGVN